MKKILFPFAFIIFSLCLFSSTSQAAAILWSELSINLDTIAFTTTGDLNVAFANGAPQGTLVSRNEVAIGDIIKGTLGSEPNYPACNYMTPNPNDGGTFVQRTWNLNSTGSGSLSINFDYFWEFAAVPWAKPDAPIGGPDNVRFWVFVNNNLLNVFQLNTDLMSVSGSDGGWHGPTNFAQGEIQTLSISMWTKANGQWIAMPVPPSSVPEPTSILLTISGLAGLGWLRRKK